MYGVAVRMPKAERRSSRRGRSAHQAESEFLLSLAVVAVAESEFLPPVVVVAMPTSTKSSKSSSKKRKEPSTGDGEKKPAEKKPSEKKPKGEGSSLAPPFLLKLYDMVTQAATDEVVQWAVGGSALMVTDVQTFTAKLLPVYFKHSSMRSFTRQLNNYGFSRESELGSEATTNSVVFAHPSFREGQRHRLAEIKRGAPRSDASASGATSAVKEEEGAAEEDDDAAEEAAARAAAARYPNPKP